MKNKGQVLVGVIVMMLIMAILIPAMVVYTQNQARWSEKGAKNSTAFQLAEAAIDRAYRKISESTGTWRNGQNGSFPTGYKYDATYTDLAGGSYTMSISSGPNKQQVTIFGIGRDRQRKEIRAIKAVYTNAAMGDIAIAGGAGVDASGQNMRVEWGSVMSQQSINTNGNTYPSYWAAGGINLDTNGAATPNCDQDNCWWWHSYYRVPAQPVIDFTLYKASAIASAVGPCGAYYTNGNRNGTCSDNSGKPYYVTGNWTDFDGPIVGSVIVLGNISTFAGILHGTSINAAVPQNAWKQYCGDWDNYQGVFETTAWTTQCPGLDNDYQSSATLTYPIEPVIWGMLYVGGDFSGPTGGGNTHMVYGILVTKGTVYLNSNSFVTIWYDSAAAENMFVTQLNLSRSSWQDVLIGWQGP